MRTLRLAGKRILITGASRGIGKALALACGREGAKLGINYSKSEDEARELCKRIGAQATLVPFDVSDEQASRAAIEAFIEQHQGLDGLVNNAGLFRPGLLATMPMDSIEAQFKVNVFGTIHCSKAVLPTFLRQKQGTIVNLGSVSARRPNRGQAAYAACKGAVESLSKAMAVEYARKGVRVHCLAPGPIATDMIQGTRLLGEKEILGRVPMRRMGHVEEVAGYAVFLLSDEASFVTGSVHVVDGGYSLG